MSGYISRCNKLIKNFVYDKPESEDKIWDLFIRKTASLLNCAVATYFEADEEKKRMSIKISIGPVSNEIKNVSFPYDGIAGWCAEKKEAVVVNDTANDPIFSKKMDTGSGFKTKNVLAVPCLADGKVMGVAEFINTMDGEFSDEAVMAAENIAFFISQLVYSEHLKETVMKLNLKGESTINNLSGGFIGTDMDKKIIFFNPKAKEIFEVGDEYIGKNVLDLMKLSPEFVNKLGDVIKFGKTVRRQEVKCDVNGKIKLIGYSSINIKGVDGKNIGSGIIFQDITDL